MRKPGDQTIPPRPACPQSSTRVIKRAASHWPDRGIVAAKALRTPSSIGSIRSRRAGLLGEMTSQREMSDCPAAHDPGPHVRTRRIVATSRELNHVHDQICRPPMVFNPSSEAPQRHQHGRRGNRQTLEQAADILTGLPLTSRQTGMAWAAGPAGRCRQRNVTQRRIVVF